MNRKLFKNLTRRKIIDSGSKSQLARVLTLFDLVGLGVGSTLGLGVYVLAGSVAYDQAGPAVVISFLIAGAASALAGLCFAEFAARVPKAGSSYIYSYVSVGEIFAFTIGWNSMFEYGIGVSSTARGMSAYIDSLIDHKMGNFLRNYMPIDATYLADYPDIFSFFIVLLLTLILAIGVKESTTINNFLTIVNVITLLIVLIVGAIHSNPENWYIKKESIPDDIRGGNGGFMPYGIAGVMSGAATCFYGFVGFDCVATAGEEAVNPQRNIPLSILISLTIVFFAYCGISIVLTMMSPYYLQDPEAPFPHVFDKLGLIEVKWIVSIGAISALSTALLGAMFPLPRIIYSMAADGLLFKHLSKINPTTKTPVIATVVSGLLSAVMALMFNLHQLIDMMSIGTLLAYTIVAICVVVLRYRDEKMASHDVKVTPSIIWMHSFSTELIQKASKLTYKVVVLYLILFSFFAIILCSILAYVKFDFSSRYTITSFFVVGICLGLTIYMIQRQPTVDVSHLSFKVPFVPLVPCLSVLVNLYLIFQLDVFTWIRFAVWICIGYAIYFTYGVKHSVEGKLQMINDYGY